MSLIKEPIITDRTGKKIASYLSIIAGTKASPGDLTYEEISRIVRSGGAADVFTIGDQIVTTYTATDGTQYAMPFDIVNLGDVTLAGGAVVPGMIIQSHYATVEGIQFDAAEPDNTLGADGAIDYKVAPNGYNRYSESGIRAWLNSKAKAGEWFEPTFERNGETVTRREADVAPRELNLYNGFMAGFPDEFLAILKNVKVTTSTNKITDDGVLDTTYDMFFLPSLENICVYPEATEGTEGGNWDYWVQRVGTTKRPTNQAFPRGITYAIENHTSAQRVRLRSAHRNFSYDTWHISTGGGPGDHSATYSHRCTPACVIC